MVFFYYLLSHVHKFVLIYIVMLLYQSQFLMAQILNGDFLFLFFEMEGVCFYLVLMNEYKDIEK